MPSQTDRSASTERIGPLESVALMVLDSPVRADVFYLGPIPSLADLAWVRYLDRAGVRVVCDVEAAGFEPERALRILRDCNGVVSVFSGDAARQDRPTDPFGESWREAGASLPNLVLIRPGPAGALVRDALPLEQLAIVEAGSPAIHGPAALEEDVELSGEAARTMDAFVASVTARRGVPAFAFLIGRLERDFAHAREAIRAAVEREAGVPCFWSGDGRHRLALGGIRHSTAWMIEHASLVIADLTLGPENPRSENPSRAHEIGLAVAFDKPLMLCSREPRRDPYFSIGDHQMLFWSDEQDLHERATEWLRAERTRVGRRVLNYRLPDWDPDCQPTVQPAAFRFDRARRYLWPLTKPFSGAELVGMSVGLGGMALAASLAAGLDEWGIAPYAGAGVMAVATLLALARWTPQVRTVLGDAARLLTPLIVVSALLVMAFAFLSLE